MIQSDELIISDCKKKLYSAKEITSCEITVPEGIEVISRWAFVDNCNLKKINLPESLKEIKQQAFYNCKNLEKIYIPSGVTEIKKETFYGCEKLKYVTGCENINKIDTFAFGHCKNLISYSFNPRLESICEYAFYFCAKLMDIKIYPSLNYIGKFAFFKCDSLEKISDNLKNLKISTGAFLDCESLKEINLDYNHLLDMENFFYKGVVNINEDNKLKFKIFINNKNLIKGKIDLESYDEFFKKHRLVNDKIFIAYTRLIDGYKLSKASENEYKKFLKSHKNELMHFLINENYVKSFENLYKYDIINMKFINMTIDYASSIGDDFNLKFLTNFLKEEVKNEKRSNE